MMSTVVSTSLSIVRERERGTMEQISVSPVHPMELVLGKTMPYVAISLISTVLILLAGFAFPIANMPKVIQFITYLNPARYFLWVLRAIILKGVTLDVMWRETL